MPRESGNPAGRRPSSRNTKPYDANNSFVRKVATKVTDFIPQSSWISKWFNTSQGNEDALEGRGNIEETELEDDVQQPSPKRSRIRMDVIHPPGTFSIQTRVKTALNTVESSKEQYPVHEVTEDILEPAIAGPSGIGHLISSTPAVQDIRTVTSHRSDLNSLASSTNNGIANGMDDNSESSESTSGCSSLIPQINRHEGPSNLLYSSTFTSRKRHVDDKLTFTNHLQSPRSLFLDSNSRDTLSSRRPSFNASIVTNAADRASPLSSPFYSGNITFGGANAAGLYKRSRNIFNNSNEIPLKIPRRTNVEVKPSDTGGVDSSGMSQTAKKILEALEHFSSPVSDAKKIPLKNTNNTVSSIMSRKRAHEEIANSSAKIGLRHLTRELTVPTVPDILKLRRRQKLQDTTLMARKIVSARSDPPPSPQEYRLRMEDTDSEKYRSKFKGKSKVNLDDEETVTPVNLPNIPLPITTLPNFNFSLPPPPSYFGKTVANKENTFTFASPIKVTDAGKSLQSINNFAFSNPINAEDGANNMTDPNSRSTTDNEFTIDYAITSIPNFIWSGSSTAPRLKTKVKNSKNDSVESTVPQELKESVMDVFFPKSNKKESNLSRQLDSGLASEMTHTDKTANTFVSSDVIITCGTESSWECSECMIRNNGTDKQCTACKISRPDPNDKISLPSTSTTDTIVVETKPIAHDCFGSQFKLSSNQWECATCCVRNKQSDVTCVACTASKPGNSSTMQQTVKSQNFDLMEKFKPAEGSWECSGCLLRNAANVIMCPCCNTSKPTTSVKIKSKKTDNVTELSAQKLNTDTDVIITQEISTNSEIMNKFKPSKDSWECSGCLVRNNSSVITCPCCSTPKPNSIDRPSKAEQTSSNGFGDKFKRPEGSWICDSCMLQNDAKHTECVACQTLKSGTVKSNESSSNTSSTLQFKFGVPSGTNLTSQPSGFKFGLDKVDDQSKSDTSPLNGFKFDNAQNSGMVQFTFGIPKEENKTVNEVSKTNSVTTSSSTTGFLFNVKSSEKSESTNQNQETKQETLFGMPKNDNPTTASEKQNTSIISSVPSTTSFTFGIQKPEFNQAVSNKETQKTSFATTVTENSKPAATDAVPINTTLPSLLTQKNITKNILNMKPESTFSFGVPSSISTAITTSTNATTTCLPTFAQPTFTFSDSKTSSQLATIPCFGQVLTSSTVLSTSVSFGGNKAIETTPLTKANDTLVATLFPIVSSSTPLFNNESKTTVAFGTDKSSSFPTTGSKLSGFAMPENKISTFGSNTESKPPIFVTSETKLPVFNTPPVASPLSTFDTASNSTTSSPFGSSNTAAFGNNITPAFGDATTTPTIFSTTKPNETNASNSSLFTFGSASSQSASSGFNFSTTVNPAATAKLLFTFGSNSSTPQNSNNTFGSGTFGVNSAPTNTANFTFNPPKQETPIAFGQGAVTTPIFGTPQANPQTQATSSFSSTPSSNTGFNFGSTAPVAATSEGFNFGGMSSTSASTGGYNFNSPASIPAVAFDPNSRPSFNFTKGSAPTIFNATPQSAQAPRKIKKAFRRCVR